MRQTGKDVLNTRMPIFQKRGGISTKSS